MLETIQHSNPMHQQWKHLPLLFYNDFTKKGLHTFCVLSVPHTHCPVSTKDRYMKVTNPDCTLITSELHKDYSKEILDNRST